MNTLTKFGLALAAVGAFTATHAHAQVRGILGAGLSIPVGDFADEDVGGAEAGGANGIIGAEWLPAGRMVGLRLDGTYNRFCTTFCEAEGGDQDIKYQVLNANLSGILELPMGTEGMVRPYLVAGGGVYNYKLHGDDVPEGDDEDETDFGVSGGLGLNIAVGRVGLFVESRFHNVFAEGTDLQYIPVTAGVRIGVR